MHGAGWLIAGGILETVGAYLFVYNIWRTTGVRAPVGPSVARRPLPARS